MFIQATPPISGWLTRTGPNSSHCVSGRAKGSGCCQGRLTGLYCRLILHQSAKAPQPECPPQFEAIGVSSHSVVRFYGTVDTDKRQLCKQLGLL